MIKCAVHNGHYIIMLCLLFVFRKYIRVTYWSLMTLTTIGERPAPETDLVSALTLWILPFVLIQ